MAAKNCNTIRIISFTIALLMLSGCSAPAGVWIAGGPAGALGYQAGLSLADELAADERKAGTEETLKGAPWHMWRIS